MLPLSLEGVLLVGITKYCIFILGRADRELREKEILNEYRAERTILRHID